MSFLAYDIGFFILFCLFVIVFIYVKRSKVKREGLIYLYKSKFGLKAIDYFGIKHKKLVSALEWPVIVICYITMAGMLYLLFRISYAFLKFPEFVRAVKIPPVMPLIPYIPEIFKIEFLPPFYFTYWLVVLAVTAIFHEFFHGIFSKKNGVRIKKTGFYFLGPFTGAFVEPDENEVKKLSFRKQAAIFGAGSFANWILTIFFFFIMWGFFALTFHPSGVMFNSYAFSFINNSEIQQVIGESQISVDGLLNLTEIKANDKTCYVKNISEGIMAAYEDSPALKAGLSGVIIGINEDKIATYDGLRESLLKRSPGENITIKTLYNKTEREYNIILGEKNDRPYIGILLISPVSSGIFGRVRSWLTFFKEPNTEYAPQSTRFRDLTIFIYNLLWWITFINLSVALGNMLPLGIFDGGRFFHVTMKKLTNETLARKILMFVTYALLFLFLLLMISWAFSIF